ncbi:hypothetical protein ABPG72_011061 [Tetrahymena utriculariae]
MIDYGQSEGQLRQMILECSQEIQLIGKKRTQEHRRDKAKQNRTLLCSSVQHSSETQNQIQYFPPIYLHDMIYIKLSIIPCYIIKKKNMAAVLVKYLCQMLKLYYPCSFYLFILATIQRNQIVITYKINGIVVAQISLITYIGTQLFISDKKQSKLWMLVDRGITNLFETSKREPNYLFLQKILIMQKQQCIFQPLNQDYANRIKLIVSVQITQSIKLSLLKQPFYPFQERQASSCRIQNNNE